jgi:hypothetical protein
MRRWTMRFLVLGLMLSTSLSWFSSQARAGIVLGPPKVTQGGDPFYVYEVPVFLQAGDTMSPVTGTGPSPVNPLTDDYLTIYNIKGFQFVVGVFSDPGLLHGLSNFTAEYNNGGFGPTPIGQTAPATVAGTYDLTFYEPAGGTSITNSGTSQLLLGYLAFRTNLPEGVPPTTILDYTDQDHHGDPPVIQSGHGTVRVVPEPASFGVLSLGAVLIFGYASRRRNRSA